ncbi:MULTISPECIES: hypothetical protein [Corynebacterium]|uniref:hypothetical protein n=1 Tax=Corynebacterium TaxID=1716 RepID=UPI00143A06FF|nr:MULTISPECIES: hypothetical protein [Corynebacterium]
MYSYLWSKLPGTPPVKWLITIVIVVAVFLLLMNVVFPWVSSFMPYNDVAV